MLTPENLLGQMLFGALGAGVLLYGKNKSSLKLMLIGLALIVYPYFIEETWMIFAVGFGLVGILIFF